MKNTPLETLVNAAFHISINCSDTFGYACADATLIDIIDLPWILPIVEKYGYDGLYACCAYIRNQEVIEPCRNEKYLAAIKELMDLKPTVESTEELNNTFVENGKYR